MNQESVYLFLSAGVACPVELPVVALPDFCVPAAFLDLLFASFSLFLFRSAFLSALEKSEAVPLPEPAVVPAPDPEVVLESVVALVGVEVPAGLPVLLFAERLFRFVQPEPTKVNAPMRIKAPRLFCFINPPL